jgi:hypothetical protein
MVLFVHDIRSHDPHIMAPFAVENRRAVQRLYNIDKITARFCIYGRWAVRENQARDFSTLAEGALGAYVNMNYATLPLFLRARI